MTPGWSGAARRSSAGTFARPASRMACAASRTASRAASRASSLAPRADSPAAAAAARGWASAARASSRAARSASRLARSARYAAELGDGESQASARVAGRATRAARKRARRKPGAESERDPFISHPGHHRGAAHEIELPLDGAREVVLEVAVRRVLLERLAGVLGGLVDDAQVLLQHADGLGIELP